jgi:tetratricopeptide (TPR) repeat protein
MQRKTIYALLLMSATFLPKFGHAALAPDQLFTQLAQSVFVVEALNESGNVVAQGSAVATKAGEVITNCHVVNDSSRIRVRQADRHYQVVIKEQDTERDLCVLSVQDLRAPAVSFRSSETLRVGERVYAIGAPLGLELTLSEGLISSLRKTDDGVIIQTSAATSPGSSGGGLFDQDGYLVGITTFQKAKGQNLNFAVPAEWINDISKRQIIALQSTAARKEFSDKAYVLQAAENWRALEKLSSKWVSEFPKDILAWYFHGKAWAELGNREKAIKSYKKAVAQPINNKDDFFDMWATWINLGLLYDKGKNYEKAVDAYKEAILLSPVEEILAGNLRNSINATGDFQKGVQVYKEIANSFPMSPIGWRGLGWSYSNLLKFREAAHAFEKFVTIEPNNVLGWIGLTVSRKMIGDSKGMHEAFATLYKLDPKAASDLVDSFTKKKIKNE